MQLIKLLKTPKRREIFNMFNSLSDFKLVTPHKPLEYRL